MGKITIIVKDKKLTKDLKDRYREVVRKVENMTLKEKRKHYEEIDSLLRDLIENKNRNFEKKVEEIRKSKVSLFADVEIACVLDKETEDCIKKLFDILTEK